MVTYKLTVQYAKQALHKIAIIANYGRRHIKLYVAYLN